MIRFHLAISRKQYEEAERLARKRKKLEGGRASMAAILRQAIIYGLPQVKADLEKNS